MIIPEEHRTYLHLKFSPNVAIRKPKYSSDEKTILKKYGSLLNALMLRKIDPLTDEQHYFLKMCYGEQHPKNDVQRTWKKYQLDIMYKVAKEMEAKIAHNIFTYDQVVSKFVTLAKQGHKASFEGIKKEGIKTIDVPENPPLVDIARIYPRPPNKCDLMNTANMLPGSYGSAKR